MWITHLAYGNDSHHSKIILYTTFCNFDKCTICRAIIHIPHRSMSLLYIASAALNEFILRVRAYAERNVRAEVAVV